MNMADLFNSSAPLALLVLLCVTSVKCYLDRADFPLKFTNDGANMVDAQAAASPVLNLRTHASENHVCPLSGKFFLHLTDSRSKPGKELIGFYLTVLDSNANDARDADSFYACYHSDKDQASAWAMEPESEEHSFYLRVADNAAGDQPGAGWYLTYSDSLEKDVRDLGYSYYLIAHADRAKATLWTMEKDVEGGDPGRNIFRAYVNLILPDLGTPYVHASTYYPADVRDDQSHYAPCHILPEKAATFELIY